MKKSIAILLVLILCLATLAACGESGQSSADQSAAVTVEEQTVLDEKGITAVVKGYGKYESELLTFDRVLLIEVTNSTEKDISFGLNDCFINGVSTDSSYYFTIGAGKTEPYPAVFDETKLEALGIKTYEEYEFCIAVQDGETNETLIETKPISVKTSAYKDGNFDYDVEGTVLYDANDVKIIALKDLVDSDIFGQYVNLYVINNTDKMIDVSVVESTLNGKAAEMSVGSYTAAGKRSVNILSVDDEKKPDKIESLTLSFSISDTETGDMIVEKTEPVTLTY